MKNRVLTIALVISMLLGVGFGPGATHSEAADLVRVDLKVLVIGHGTANPSFDAWTALLDREGVPFDVFDSSGAPLTAGDLSAPDHAYYQAVVCATSCAADLGWASPELATLDAFQATFGIRRVNAFAFPGAVFGLNDVADGQEVGGDVLNLTTAGSAVFPYLAGPILVDTFTYGYYATVADPGAHETLLTGPGSASVVGVYSNPAGFEELVVTIDTNQYQLHAMLLGHGQLSWATQGIYLGYNRNYFAGHFDDIFLPDDRWDMASNTTPEDDGATVPLIRMEASDVSLASTWQATNGIRLDFVFNGAGSDEAIADNGSDALTDALLAQKDSFYWINHTYGHINLDTVTQAVIEADIADNLTFADANGIVYDATELVTGEHSGLHNAAMPAALTSQGIEWVAADNSREPTPYTIGSAITVPRHPANVYYNVGTEVEQLHEYNFIYNINRGCVNTSTTTCNDRDLTWTEYVSSEADIMLPHMITNDPRPHYFHQANLAEDGVFYTVFSEVLSRYNTYFSVDLIQPTFTEVGEIMERASAWHSVKDSVTAYTLGGSIHLTAPSAVNAPITGIPAGGDLYGSERSDWIQIGPTETVIVTDLTAPVISLLGSNPQSILVGGSYAESGATALDNVDGDLTTSIVIDASAVDTAIVGPYSVTYNVADSSGNDAAEVTRTVNVVDTTLPVISLVGPNPQTIEVGGSYAEAGATATDNYDGDLSSAIVIDASAANTAAVGMYPVTYNVADSSSNDAVQVTRTVNVVDTAAPVISLLGLNPQSFFVGDSYLEAGATAADVGDGDLSSSIVIDATALNTLVVGSYPVTYNVADSSGNDAVQVTRTVNVVDAPPPGPTDFFVDDDVSVFEADINAIAAVGITLGCNPPANDMFCPGESVTRGQMAAFLARALGI